MRNWFRRRRFTKALHKVAGERWTDGQITEEEYMQIDRACGDSKVMSQLIAQTQTADGLYGGIKDWDWASIVLWIQNNLIPLIRALLPLLTLLADEEDKS
jgi:hypothetical protein